MYQVWIEINQICPQRVREQYTPAYLDSINLAHRPFILQGHFSWLMLDSVILYTPKRT